MKDKKNDAAGPGSGTATLIMRAKRPTLIAEQFEMFSSKKTVLRSQSGAARSRIFWSEPELELEP
jgi:hypothetical protein